MANQRQSNIEWRNGQLVHANPDEYDDDDDDGTSTVKGDDSDNDGSTVIDGATDRSNTIQAITSAMNSDADHAVQVLYMLSRASQMDGNESVSADIAQFTNAINAYNNSRHCADPHSQKVLDTALNFLKVKSRIDAKYNIDHPAFVAQIKREIADPSLVLHERAITYSEEVGADTSRDDPPELAHTSSEEVRANTSHEDPSHSERRGGSSSIISRLCDGFSRRYHGFW
ncbi:hypothetical protein I302_107734 [Kwoniella bestiolae CBS 10118]|uniref:Uncharacterized protein n=1 Tax=Kwoniella bestiolae CBS 10118 TaxID=1296100 RepID=A0AAJ8KD37_9TREE